MNIDTVLSAKVSRNAKMIYLRRYMGITLQEIGSIFGVTYQRAQQICRKVDPVVTKQKPHKMTKSERKELSFWKNVQIAGENDCWLWIGATHGGKEGYRYGTLDGRIYSHRFSYFLHNDSGEGDGGTMEVCHKCNNPLCVNPKHLYLGTHKQNMADREQRYKTGDLIRTGGVKSKHSDDIVRALKEAKNPYALARQNGIPYGSVHALLRRNVL